jgi:hypothetical protein
MASYVAPYSTGWVVLVNDKWYGPDCVLGSAVWPNLDSVVWPDLVAAQNCYNAKIGGVVPPSGKDPAQQIEDFLRLHFTTYLLAGGILFGGVLIMKQMGRRR